MIVRQRNECFPERLRLLRTQLSYSCAVLALPILQFHGTEDTRLQV